MFYDFVPAITTYICTLCTSKTEYCLENIDKFVYEGIVLLVYEGTVKVSGAPQSWVSYWQYHPCLFKGFTSVYCLM